MRILVFSLLACVTAAAAPDGPGFELAGSGIDFRHRFGGEKMTRIVEATGPGVGLFDADGDGDLDVYFVNGGWLEGISSDTKAKQAKNRLYRNDGGWKFTDITDQAGVGDPGYGMGCTAADYDGDGHVDLYVTNYGPNVLFRNNGDGTFTDVTGKAGVGGPAKLNGWTKWSTNSIFFDADGDSDLDLYVCNYLAFDPDFLEYYGPEGFPGPSSYLGQPSLLYRNDGNGKFTDLTKEAGLWQNDGRGMGASVIDVDGDGRPDIFEANDNMQNYLFRNLGGGKFKNIAVAALVAYGQMGENTAAMHASVDDYDADGRLDLLVADANFSALYRNDGSSRFVDAAEGSGLAKLCGRYASWGAFFFDYDNDGTLDVFLANGGAHHLYGQQNLVLRGTGDARFTDVSLALGRRVFFKKRTSRGAACGDIDNDGDPDVVVQNIDKDGSPTLYENRAAGGHHWIGFLLKGAGPNPQALGAKVTVVAGGRTRVSYVQTCASYLSSCDPRRLFGLGKTGSITRVEVRWPSGKVNVFQNLAIDRYHTLEEEG
ncbi:MAG: CRTAC1 family protein [Planctomycetota bacterium]|jgi:hypothetical protein